MRLLGIFVALAASLVASAAEVVPPKPARYFNDYAHVVSPATAAELNQRLEQFERDTSSQIVVAVYPKMESESSIEDYTVRVAQSWGVGQKEKSNGAVLFVFVQDRKMYIQIGHGLEGALPDALATRIIETEITPRFRNGDFDGGLRAGVAAILAATKGEYKGTGRTVADRFAAHGSQTPDWVVGLFIAFWILIILGALLSHAAGGTVYTRGGRIVSYGLGSMWAGGGGGFSSGGGGGFSGGGGVSGGGGGVGG